MWRICAVVKSRYQSRITSYNVCYTKLLRDDIIKRSRWRQAMLAFALLSIPLLLVVILSRAGQVGAVLAVGLLLPLLWKHNWRLGLLATLALMLSLLAGILCLYFVHMGRGIDSYGLTTSYRLLYWSHVWDMFRESPWQGVV